MYLGSFKQAEFAYTFADYLSTKNIKIRVETDQQNGYSLFWDGENSEELELIRQELQLYLSNPLDKKYQQATWQSGNKVNLSKSYPVKQTINNLLPKISPNGPFTITIFIICIAVFIFLLMQGNFKILSYLGFPVTTEHRLEFWRYITPIFIHFSVLHILFNLTWWWYLGGMVERYQSVWKLLEITLVTGLISNFAQDFITGPYFGGLSGVVYGLMGYVWLIGEKGHNIHIKLERTMMIIAGVWVLAGYLNIVSDMANTAHLTGLLVGLLIALKDIYLSKTKAL